MPKSELSIELSIRVSDGSFESRWSLPVSATKEQRDAFANMWMDGMLLALKSCSAEGRDEG